MECVLLILRCLKRKEAEKEQEKIAKQQEKEQTRQKQEEKKKEGRREEKRSWEERNHGNYCKREEGRKRWMTRHILLYDDLRRWNLPRDRWRSSVACYTLGVDVWLPSAQRSRARELFHMFMFVLLVCEFHERWVIQTRSMIYLCPLTLQRNVKYCVGWHCRGVSGGRFSFLLKPLVKQ